MKRCDVPIQSLLDMDFSDSRERAAGIYRQRGPAELDTLVDNDFRSSTLKIDILPVEYPEVCDALLKMINIWDPSLNPNDFYIGEFNYLKYGKGDRFRAHRDRLPGNTAPASKRIFSTSTIVKVSDDLTGGDFNIADPAVQYAFLTVPLKVGETLFFDSFTRHEVTEITQGNREVLVAWIHYK